MFTTTPSTTVDPTTGITFNTPGRDLIKATKSLTEKQYQTSLGFIEAERTTLRDEMGAYSFERYRYQLEGLPVGHLDAKLNHLAHSYHRVTRRMLTMKCARGEL